MPKHTLSLDEKRYCELLASEGYKSTEAAREIWPNGVHHVSGNPQPEKSYNYWIYQKVRRLSENVLAKSYMEELDRQWHMKYRDLEKLAFRKVSSVIQDVDHKNFVGSLHYIAGRLDKLAEKLGEVPEKNVNVEWNVTIKPPELPDDS